MESRILESATRLGPRITEWRRRLHRVAEVGMDLPRTRETLEEILGEIGIVPERLGPGLIADLPGRERGPMLLIRSDMDALPLREETGLPFACPDGAMHACGHDAHMAMLLGAGALLAGREGTPPPFPVRLLFQPAEELGRGALAMIEAGCLEGVEAVCGLHVGRLFDELGPGQVGIIEGTAMAGMDRFEVLLRGKGVHGATPHKGIDPIVMAGELIGILQTLVSREIPPTRPAVVSVGRIEGGNAFNVIPEEVRLEGTFRAVSREDQERIGRRIDEMARGVAALHGGEAESLWERRGAPLVNDRAFTAFFRTVVGRVLPPEDRVELRTPTTVGEDMALYLERRPGTFFFLGVGPGYPHHHPKFDLDEEVLPRGAALFAQTALDFREFRPSGGAR